MSLRTTSAILVIGIALVAGCAEVASDDVNPATGPTDIDLSLPLGVQLEEAIRAGDVDRVQVVVADFTDLDTDLPVGLPPLHFAAQVNQPEIVSILIDAGASIETRDVQGRTPLMVASSFAEASVIQECLDAGADVSAANSVALQAAAWHYAAHHGNVAALEMLLDEGADINAVDAVDWTALHYAAHNGQLEAVEFLLTHGIGVNLRDHHNSTALGWAEYEGFPEVAEAIAAAGGER
ncbi:MAG: ankyrin repeat domain-containing protein [Demequinaceae bacterium]|nr:ankyrin repeat domain-containing protein [Demequinaceae bacterium]